jgi:hypothetical protein
MPRVANTSARDYGFPHQQLRRMLLANWQPGDKCAICGLPMWSRWAFNAKTGNRVRAIDLAHDRVNGGYLGLSHRRCNRGKSNRRRAQADGRESRRRWLVLQP